MAPALRCGPMMGLPPDLEEAFWQDSNTLRAYTMWDGLAIVTQLLTALLMAKTFWPLLLDAAVLPYVGHVHLIVAANAGCALATALIMVQHPRLYARHRHRLVVLNRLVRFATTVLAAWRENPQMQREMLRQFGAVNRIVPDSSAWRPGANAGLAEQLLAALTMLRPVTWPMLMLSQGCWAFRLSWWLPLQVVNMMISCQWVLTQTVCSMSTDNLPAQLVRPACRVMSGMHELLLGSLHGSLYGRVGGAESPTCNDPRTAAQALAWYSWLTYGVVVWALGFARLEWRTKAAFVKKHAGRQLSYEPWSWGLGLSEGGSGGGEEGDDGGAQDHAMAPNGGGELPPDCGDDGHAQGSALQRAVTWCVALPTAFGVVWFLLLAIIPLLPRQPCRMYARLESAEPPPPLCESAWCLSAGLWTAAAINLQLIFTLGIHLRALAS